MIDKKLAKTQDVDKLAFFPPKAFKHSPSGMISVNQLFNNNMAKLTNTSYFGTNQCGGANEKAGRIQWS